MAQLMSVKLSRSDASPWGFRLQGGKDFGSPLLIQKVNGGSPAERAGLQAGDAVIKVNNVEVFNLRHKDAQDNIMRAGNGFEITVQRGGSTWKPAVTPVGPQPVMPQSAGHITPVTKTSLAATKPAASPIGGGHNYSPAPFAPQQMNGNGVDPVKSIVNKQYNSPVGIYSEETIAETLSAQAEVLAGGVLGVNFKKNERNYDPANSEVLKMLNEYANEPRTPEPEVPTPCFEAPAPIAPSVPFSVAGLRRVAAPETRPVDQQKTSLPAGQNICGECERLVVGVFVRIKDKNLHVECFKCATCGSSLKNVGYYNVNNKLYCDVHAKLVARQQPPGPNLEPVTVAPGAQKPAGAIAAALANRGPMAPAPAPASPLASNFAPMPFHAPGGFAGMKPNFNAAQTLPSMLSKQSVPAMPVMPSMPSAPVPAPFTTPAKPAAAGSKCAWPPNNPPEELSCPSTATPLYIPPEPLHQSASVVSLTDQSGTVVRRSSIRSEYSVPSVQPFPQPLGEFLSRPMSAYRYVPKALGSNDARPKSAFAEPTKAFSAQRVTFDRDVEWSESSQRKKFSVCSQEVTGITEGGGALERLSESIDTAILVSALTGRPESPVPMEHVRLDGAGCDQAESFAHEDEEELVVGLKHVIETQGAQAKRSSVGEVQNTQAKRSSVGEVQNTQAKRSSIIETQGVQAKRSSVIETQGVQAKRSSVIETQGAQAKRSSIIENTQAKRSSIGEVQNPQTKRSSIIETQGVQAKRSSVGQLQPIGPQPWHSPFVSALTTAPDRPYSPLPSAPACPTTPKTVSPRPTTLPVSYKQLPQPTTGFVPIPRDETNPAQPSTLVSALTVAPDRPYSPLPQPPAPLPTKPVPYPDQTTPYQPPRSDSPMISALTVAPRRPYSPFTVTKAPTSVLDSLHVTSSNTEPFNLPTPSQYTSMVTALTIAPDRPYTPLNVTQAPSTATQAEPINTHHDSPFNTAPQNIAGDIQGAVYKPTAVVATQPLTTNTKQPVEDTPTKAPVVKVSEADVAKAPQRKQKPQKTQQKAVKVATEPTVVPEPPNALNQRRPTQQRPITPRLPRPLTPSTITGLHKPAAIPYYQQGIADGDFPCRSPRPATPTLICPMTVPRPRSVTPLPHKQLDVVRSQTPLASRHSAAPQVVVTRNTRVTEEFESFHKESSQVIETTGNTRKCVSQRDLTSAVARQSEMLNREVTAITQGESSTSQSSQLSAQSQRITYDSQHDSQTTAPAAIQTTKPRETFKLQDSPNGDFMTLEESQRASPLPFPNISLPKGMTYDVVDDKAMYTTGKNRQVFKLNQTRSKETSSQFRIQAPTHKDPFVQLMAPKFEPKVLVVPSASSSLTQPPPQAVSIPPYNNTPSTNNMPASQQPPPQPNPIVPSYNNIPASQQPPPQPAPIPSYNNKPAPQQPARQTVQFQPLAPQPVPAVSKPIQAPTATLPVNVTAGGNFQPAVTQGTHGFTPRSSGNGFQHFNPRPASPPNVIPSVRDAGVAPCISPPNAGGGSGPKGASFAGSSAPVRGRGVLNQATAPGARQATCGQCQSQVRGPFVTALGKIWCPEHFVCVNAQCKRQLADIGFVEEKGQLYCEYCFEQYIAPSCTKCSGKIKGDCLNAIGKSYHPECFVCCYCNKLFGNNPFFLEDGMAYCQADWNELFTTKCFACGFPIEAGDRWVEALNNNYHSQCFNCTSCKKNLEGQSFFAKSGRPFCKAHAR